MTPSGVNGPDVQLGAEAARFWPFAIECKKHAAFAVYQHYDQAREGMRPGDIQPVLVIEANRREPLVVVDAEWFFGMWADYRQLRK